MSGTSSFNREITVISIMITLTSPLFGFFALHGGTLSLITGSLIIHQKKPYWQWGLICLVLGGLAVIYSIVYMLAPRPIVPE